MNRKVQEIEVDNRTAAGGVPDGGDYLVNDDSGIACLMIRWQRGPLVDINGLEQPANGLFLVTLLRAGRERLRYYQEETKFNCPENAEAVKAIDESLRNLDLAINALETRADRRAAAGTLGTHEPDDETPKKTSKP